MYHWSHLKQGKSWPIMCSCSSCRGEHKGESMQLHQIYRISRQEKKNSIACLLQRSYQWLNIGLMFSTAIFLFHTCQSFSDVFCPLLTASLSVSLPSRVDSPDSTPKKRSYQGGIHLDSISTLRDWKKEMWRKGRTGKSTQGSDILLKLQDLNPAGLQKFKSSWIYITVWNKRVDPCVSFTETSAPIIPSGK